MLRLVRLAALAALVSLPLIGVPPSPAAACSSAPAPFDSFTAAVPGAGTIVVGTVEGLSKQEKHARFRLNIDEVLRGKAPSAMRFSGLSGSEARSACGDPNYVEAREGDRLALALSAAVPGQPLDVDAVAFVGDSTPDRRRMPKIERLPLRKVRQLAGQKPDGSTIRRPYDAGAAADNLITQRVAPGIARVSKLGTKHDLDAVRHLDVSDQNRVWATTRDSAFQLAQRQEHGPRDGVPRRVNTISTGPDGYALADGSGVSLFEDHRGWKKLSAGAGEDGLRSPLMTSDGTTWALSNGGAARLDGDEWTWFDWDHIDPPAACVDPAKRGEALDCTLTNLAESPDGSVWLGFHTYTWKSHFGGGLRRFDGEAWTEVPDPMDMESYAVADLTSYPGGPLWALVVPTHPTKQGGDYDRAQLARWDGETWTRFELPSELRTGRRSQPRELVAGPDGAVWLSRPLASFDGEMWRYYDTPSRTSSKNPRVQDLSIAPDGSAWIVVRDTVKYDTTRPDGIYILDPARAKSTRDVAAVALAAAPDPG